MIEPKDLKTDRDIHTAVIHCSATPEGRDVKVSEIKDWHLQRGWSDIGYHYVIELDGTIRKGRPLDRIGAHVRGHNKGSIGICYVGGVDKNMKPKDTKTKEQSKSLAALSILLKDMYPNIEFKGHRDFEGVAKACPSFDVAEFMRNLGQYLFC